MIVFDSYEYLCSFMLKNGYLNKMKCLHMPWTSTLVRRELVCVGGIQEWADFGALGILTRTARLSLWLRSRPDLDLCDLGQFFVARVSDTDAGFGSQFLLWSSVRFAHTTWGLTLGWPPCLFTNEIFCDLICVHFKCDHLLKDQCSVALREGCFRGVLAGSFPVCSSSVCAQVRAPRGFYRRSSRQRRFAF